MERLNVFLTVDVEMSPSLWEKYGMEETYKRCILGESSGKSYGLPYLVSQLKKNNLKATFFVEPLFTLGGEIDLLHEIVDLITSADQEIQLHIHTEWLKIFDIPIDPKEGFSGRNMSDYSVDKQIEIISLGLSQLRKCKVSRICAFRAGNYGANFDTLCALKHNKIRLDTSYNYTYLSKDCDLYTEVPLLQPSLIDGVQEVPISFFEQFPGSFRHSQVIACSFSEIKNMMVLARNKRWYSFVIVLHSFELVNRDNSRLILVAKNRFDKLCKYLKTNTFMFNTIGFSAVDKEIILVEPECTFLSSGIFSTVFRYVSQLFQRF